ncbi:MAG: SDR family oxidoreductase [Chloroflexi bacterium]|nr:SDR family oxidoreductase [Chloroflexota bacterium]
MGRFDGKVAFVTGGGTGIGLACARAVVEGGGSVVLGGRREDVVLAAASALGARAAGVPCDVTDDASVDAGVAAAVERFGALHLAVNAAGMGAVGSVLNSNAADFSRTLDTNLTGVFRSMRSEARAMMAGGGGSIVNISSIAGGLTHRWMSAYCASKAGLNMLTMCAADDLGEHNIRVNAVMPGLVYTDLAAGLTGSDVATDEYRRCMPLARLGQPEDIARAVAFLLSDDAAWITGQCLPVDGGHTVRKGPDLVPLFSQFLPATR